MAHERLHRRGDRLDRARARAGRLEAADLDAALRRQPVGGGQEIDGAPVYASAAEALDGVDVLIDYTSATAVKANTLAAIEAGVARRDRQLGADRRRLRRDRRGGARARRRRVASGNFSLTAAMCQAGALLAARHLPHWEVIDYANAAKPDVPVGDGARARRAARRGAPARARRTRSTSSHGPQEARGATVGGTQVHSVRLPSFVVSTEVVFGLPDERLTIRHDAGGTPEPYVAGTLLAVRRVSELVGLTRGLDTLLLGA